MLSSKSAEVYSRGHFSRHFLNCFLEISQAGRRGFDPRLPLFRLNNLEATPYGVTAELPHQADSIHHHRFAFRLLDWYIPARC